MIDRLRLALTDVDALTWPKGHDGRSRDDYVQVSEDLLAPKELGVRFVAGLYQSETEEREELSLGKVEGVMVIQNGSPSIYSLSVESDRGDADSRGSQVAITSGFLERIPLAELALRVTARCCLTRWQDAHYSVVPMPEEPLARMIEKATELSFVVRQIGALADDEPLPVREPPKPRLVDEDGIPWYRVIVTPDAVRRLNSSRLKRPRRLTTEFLGDVWRVYSAAKRAGIPTTDAVRELGLERTGRIPSRPTIQRWIKQAKEQYGGSSRAKD